jgi:hypothetical protein
MSKIIRNRVIAFMTANCAAPDSGEYASELCVRIARQYVAYVTNAIEQRYLNVICELSVDGVLVADEDNRLYIEVSK